MRHLRQRVPLLLILPVRELRVAGEPQVRRRAPRCRRRGGWRGRTALRRHHQLHVLAHHLLSAIRRQNVRVAHALVVATSLAFGSHGWNKGPV
jgi:hypothetical protein